MLYLKNNFQLYYHFYQVATEMNFTKAAEKNHISQSALSRNVKSLEELLHLNLINRNNKGITLTSDGEKLYNKLDVVFSEIDKFDLNDFSDDKDVKGHLTIGTTRNIADYKLSNYLSIFKKKYTKVKISILIDSSTSLNDYLMSHKIDVLIDYLPHINYSQKYDLKVEAINQFNTCFACSKNYYEKISNTVKSLRDLNKYNLIIPGSSRRRQMLDEILQYNNIVLETSIEMPDSKLMVDFVSNNEYIGYFIEEELEYTNLEKINLKEKMPINPIGLIYSKNTINNITKKFIELVLNK